MKKIIVLSLLLCANFLAQAKETNNVWYPFVGGNLEAICRHLWLQIDSTYGTNSVLNLKQGVGGELATKDMLDSRLSNRSICAAGAMVVSNDLLFPNTATYGPELDMLIKIVNFPIVWYTPNATPAVNSLDGYVSYLKSLNRPINVGVFQGPFKPIALYLAKKHSLPINIVLYKSTPQFYPDLVSGALDLALDSGGGVGVAEEGRFRIIGYSSPVKFDRLAKYPNFGSNDQELTRLESWFGIAVPKNSDPVYRDRLLQQLNSMVKQPSFQEFALRSLGQPSGLSGAALANNIREQQQTFRKYWQ